MQSEDYLIFAGALSRKLQDFVKKSSLQYLKILGNFISIFQDFFFFLRILPYSQKKNYLVKNTVLKQIVKQPHCWDSSVSKKTQLLVSLISRC